MTRNMKRSESVELCRCVLMFGIVLLHVISQGGYCQRGVDRILLSCVDGFVFISGYYGIRFSNGKAIRLILIGVWCFIVSAFIRTVIDTPGLGEFSFTEHVYFDIMRWSWFLWAYLILMFFAPIFEIAFEALKTDRTKLIKVFSPLLFLTFGWMYLTQIPGLNFFIPRPSGFGVTTFLCLIGIYVAARLFRYIELESYINSKVLIFGCTVCAVMCLVGFGHYNSIFALCMSCFIFCGFKRAIVHRFVGTIAMKISPSMFSVYLLHSNAVGFTYCKELNAFFIEQCQVHVWITWFFTATIVFLVCVLIDCIRRIGLSMCGLILCRLKRK